MEIVHNKLYRIDAQWYWEDEPISTEQGEELREHYFEVVDKLAAPWKNRNDNYDVTGRFNTGGQEAYE